jgi:hypothetical protein
MIRSADFFSMLAGIFVRAAGFFLHLGEVLLKPVISLLY